MGNTEENMLAQVDEAMDAGLELVDAGDYAAAVAKLETAEKLAAEAGATDLVAAARINRGYAQFEAGDLEAAAALYAEGAEMAREANDPEKLAIALANLGIALNGVGRFAEAIEAYDEHLGIEGADAAGLARTRIGRGLANLELGDFASAGDDFDEAHLIARKAGYLDLAAYALNNMGYAYDRENDLPAAAVAWDKALEVARQSASDDVIKPILINLANARRRNGDNAAAEPLYDELEQLYRESGEMSALANSLYWHGVSLRGCGWPDYACKLWKESEEICRELGQYGDLADCLIAQAEVDIAGDKPELAFPKYTEAEEICRTEGYQEVLVDALYAHGFAAYEAGAPVDVYELMREALEVAKESGYADKTPLLQSLYARTLAERQETEAAYSALGDAESVANRKRDFFAALMAMLARAYVMIHAGEPAGEVADQIKAAYRFALEKKLASTVRTQSGQLLERVKPIVDEEYFAVIEAMDAEMCREQDSFAE